MIWTVSYGGHDRGIVNEPDYARALVAATDFFGFYTNAKGEHCKRTLHLRPGDTQKILMGEWSG